MKGVSVISRFMMLGIDAITCLPQVRERIDAESLVGLAQSIVENGLLQFILVRREGDRFIVVDGHRRLQACRMAGLTEVPVIITDRERDSAEVTLCQLVANTQRENLNPIDRARAFARLIDESGWSAAEVARRAGFSESTVSRLTALLTLPPDVIKRVEAGDLPASTAYQIAIAGDGESQARLASDAANGVLSRDAVARQAKRNRGARQRGKPRAKRRALPRFTLSLGQGRSITIAGTGLTLKFAAESLQSLVDRMRALELQGMELTEAVKALATKES